MRCAVMLFNIVRCASASVNGGFNKIATRIVRACKNIFFIAFQEVRLLRTRFSQRGAIAGRLSSVTIKQNVRRMADSINEAINSLEYNRKLLRLSSPCLSTQLVVRKFYEDTVDLTYTRTLYKYLSTLNIAYLIREC